MDVTICVKIEIRQGTSEIFVVVVLFFDGEEVALTLSTFYCFQQRMLPIYSM